MNYFKLKMIFCFYCTGRPTGRPRPVCRPASYPRQPAHWPAQTGHQAGHGPEGAGLLAGPDRGQAGAAPEAAGLEAGPGRGQGRARLGDHARVAGQMPRPARRRGDHRRWHRWGGQTSVRGSGLTRAFDAPNDRKPQTGDATIDWSPKRRVRRRQTAAGVGLRP